MSDDYDVGVLVAGPVSAPRCLVEHRATLAAFAQDETQYYGEAYLSHYQFGPGMESHYKRNGGSVAGFNGPCRADWLLWDIDEHDPVAALTAARQLVGFIQQRYRTDPAVWFSGAKGYHVGLRLAHDPSPSATFPTVARVVAEGFALAAGVRVDSALYDLNRIVRLPNTKHAKTERFKVPLLADELLELTPQAVWQRAAHPRGMSLPIWRGDTGKLADDWAAAEASVGRAAQARAERRAEFEPDARAPLYLLRFLRFGTGEGERAMTLFRCAAWLTEQGAPPSLCAALLTEPALDCALSPSETARQIRCGIEHAQRQRGGAVNAVAAEAPAAAPAQAPACPSAQAPAQAPARPLTEALDRLAHDALTIQRAVLAEGERRGFPAVSLGPGRTLGPGRLAWEAFVRSNCPAPHRDGLDLADWLAALGRDYESYERWCIQHESDPWPTPTFDFGANAPVEETSDEPTPTLADVPTQPTSAARWQAVLERLTGDPQAVQQALQQLSIPDVDLTRQAKGRLPT
jgi:hypothetical protein